MITAPPWRRSIIGATAALIVFHTPVRLMSIISCHICSSISSAGAKLPMPALAHTTSMWPNSEMPSCDDRLELAEVAHVGLAGHDAAVEVLDELGRLGQIVRRRHRVRDRLDGLAQVDGDDLGALLRQPQRVRAALPARRSRDERDLAVHPTHGGPQLFGPIDAPPRAGTDRTTTPAERQPSVRCGPDAGDRADLAPWRRRSASTPSR